MTAGAINRPNIHKIPGISISYANILVMTFIEATELLGRKGFLLGSSVFNVLEGYHG